MSIHDGVMQKTPYSIWFAVMSSDVLIKKILILAANPQSMNKLRLDKEARDIKEGLRQSREREQFVIDSEWAVRPKDIRRAILYFRPQIVHFSGHGAEDGGLAFEDEIGQIKLVRPEALAGLFKLFSEHVDCVILNACYSEIQANAISQHIDFVIGMNKAIGDIAATEFAVGFYDALGAGCSVEVAYKFGCNAIHMADIKEQFTPVLRRKKDSFPSPPSSTDCVPESPTRSVSFKHTQVVYEFVLTGSVDEVSKQKLEAVVAHLRGITGDTLLTLLRIESGSIRLILEGSEEGFRLLQSLIENGELEQVLDIHVQRIEQKEPSFFLEPVNQVDQLTQNTRDAFSSSIEFESVTEKLLYQLGTTALVAAKITDNNERTNWDNFFESLISQKSAEGRMLYVFVSQCLRQYKLHGEYDTTFILSEVYIRGLKALNSGSKISNFSAWSRSTAYKIVREISHQRQREHSNQRLAELEDSEYSEKGISEDSVSQQISMMRQAFQKLTEEDQELLTLKIVEGLSWSEISKQLGLSSSVLRQRKSRVLRELRSNFNEPLEEN
jgi:RNA polymerase sigma factor (sigma-70 family)